MKPIDQSFDSDSGLGTDGWTAIADALEGITSLTSLNQGLMCRDIREGGKSKLLLNNKELGVWAGRYLPRSASTLTMLDLRCADAAGMAVMAR